MGSTALLTVLLAAALVPANGAEAPCAGVDLVVGASRPAVRGVVEREAVAANPLPWGGSVAVVTRVWGAVTVERWVGADEIADCLMPSDTPVYEAVGIAELLLPAGGTLSGLEQAALNSEFGPPAVFDPSGFDRAMAWLRVFPSIPVVALIVGWAAVTLRRRRRRSEPYLF